MSDDGSTARVVEIMEDYYGTHAYSTEAAFTALARDYAALTADRDRLAAELATAQQRIEWASAALHGDPLFGPGCDEPLVRGIQAFGGERLAADDARANLLLQTICRLPDVLTEGDWQQWLDQHRDEWLNDDRAFGGWVAQRLREYVERLAAKVDDLLKQARLREIGCANQEERADKAEADLEAVRLVDDCDGTVYRDDEGMWTHTPGRCDECDSGAMTDADVAGGYFSPPCDNESDHAVTHADSLIALGRALAAREAK